MAFNTSGNNMTFSASATNKKGVHKFPETGILFNSDVTAVSRPDICPALSKSNNGKMGFVLAQVEEPVNSNPNISESASVALSVSEAAHWDNRTGGITNQVLASSMTKVENIAITPAKTVIPRSSEPVSGGLTTIYAQGAGCPSQTGKAATKLNNDPIIISEPLGGATPLGEPRDLVFSTQKDAEQIGLTYLNENEVFQRRSETNRFSNSGANIVEEPLMKSSKPNPPSSMMGAFKWSQESDNSLLIKILFFTPMVLFWDLIVIMPYYNKELDTSALIHVAVQIFFFANVMGNAFFAITAKDEQPQNVWDGRNPGVGCRRYFLLTVFHYFFGGIYNLVYQFEHTWNYTGNGAMACLISLMLTPAALLRGDISIYGFFVITLQQLGGASVCGALMEVIKQVYFIGHCQELNKGGIGNYLRSVCRSLGTRWYLTWILPIIPSPVLADYAAFEKKSDSFS